MVEPAYRQPRRILIVSSHPLFGKGLRNLLKNRSTTALHVVNSVEAAMSSIESFKPDLVVVDYDDDKVDRRDFLSRFVDSALRLRVVLLSLKEGGSQAVIYDRHTLAANQIDEWMSWIYE